MKPVVGPAAYAIMDELNRRKAVVYTHPTTANCCRNLASEVPDLVIEYGTDTTRAIAGLLFSGTATRCPDIRFIFSHGGGTLPFLIERFTRLPELNQRLQPRVPQGVMHELRRLYYDTAQLSSAIALASLLRLVSSAQVLGGTDSRSALVLTMSVVWGRLDCRSRIWRRLNGTTR